MPPPSPHTSYPLHPIPASSLIPHPSGRCAFRIADEPELSSSFSSCTTDPGLLPGYESILKGDIGKKQKMVKQVSRTVSVIRPHTMSCQLLNGPADPSLGHSHVAHGITPRQMLHSFYLSTFSPDQETGTPFAVDAIISNPPAFAAEHLAEMGGIPLVMSFSTCWVGSLGGRRVQRLAGLKISFLVPQLHSHALVPYDRIQSPSRQRLPIQRRSRSHQLPHVRSRRSHDLARSRRDHQSFSSSRSSPGSVTKRGWTGFGRSVETALHVLLESDCDSETI